MNYSNPNITQRAQESSLWEDLSRQNNEALPYLLERYLLLEKWNLNKLRDSEQILYKTSVDYDIDFIHLLIAELTTVVSNQEERIRSLENQVTTLNQTASHYWENSGETYC